jgi:hypothetical protein
MLDVGLIAPLTIGRKWKLGTSVTALLDDRNAARTQKRSLFTSRS